MEQDLLKQILNKLNGIEADVAGIKAEQQKTNERLDNIEKDTVHIKQAVSEVNREVIAASEKIQQLQETAQDYKAALDILSARSIEQEAKLVRFK